MTTIQGTCDPAFEPVRAAFAANFEQGNELGASTCVTLRGEPVVDLWAGDRDLEGSPWEQDTIVNVWSTTKTMAATVLLVLADRGLLDLDAPIADVWPEFAANGKGAITMAQVMGHTAGLPGFVPTISPDDLYDQDVCAANLAAQVPWWEPGTMSGYHLLTQGYLEAEVVRRVTGTTLGTYFRTEIAEPLGADFHIGLPASEEHRVGYVTPPADPLGVVAGKDPESNGVRAGLSVRVTGNEQNTRAWRAAEIPAAGGTSNARGVARVHAMLANGGTLDGVRILSPEGVDRIFVEQSHTTDAVLGVPCLLYTSAIGRALDQKASLIRLPGDRSASLRAALRQVSGDGDELDEEHARLHRLATPTSLDRTVGDDDGSELVDLLADGLPGPEEMAVANEDDRMVTGLLDVLDTRARFAVEQRFGLHDGRKRSYREVGEELGVTAEAARRMVKRAVNTVRNEAASRIDAA